MIFSFYIRTGNGMIIYLRLETIYIHFDIRNNKMIYRSFAFKMNNLS